MTPKTHHAKMWGGGAKNGEVAKPYNWTDTEIDQLDRQRQ